MLANDICPTPYTNTYLQMASDCLYYLDPVKDSTLSRKIRVVVGGSLMNAGASLLIVGKANVETFYYKWDSASPITNVFGSIFGTGCLISGIALVGYGLGWAVLPKNTKNQNSV